MIYRRTIRIQDGFAGGLNCLFEIRIYLLDLNFPDGLMFKSMFLVNFVGIFLLYGLDLINEFFDWFL